MAAQGGVSTSPTFRETRPVVEWISDSSLRMGEARSDQSFFDEINVTSETNEKLKVLERWLRQE